MFLTSFYFLSVVLFGILVEEPIALVSNDPSEHLFDDILTNEQVFLLEKQYDEALLMDRAGLSLSNFIARSLLFELTRMNKITAYNRHVLVLVGGGNNGGDALIAASHLCSEGWSVDLLPMGRSSPNRQLFEQAIRSGCQSLLPSLQPPQHFNSSTISYSSTISSILFSDYIVVVDGMLGTGFRPPLTDIPTLAVIQSLAQLRRENNGLVCSIHIKNGGAGYRFLEPDTRAQLHSLPVVVAVDVPSGLSQSTASDVALRADFTVTFGSVKQALVQWSHSSDFSGKLVVADIFDEEPRRVARLWLAPVIPSPVWVRSVIPWRRQSSYKTGHVLVIGGSSHFPGAPVLAARAAMRLGAGYARLVTPGPLLHRSQQLFPELTVLPLNGSSDYFSVDHARALFHDGNQHELNRQRTAVVLGPGLSAKGWPFVREFLALWKHGSGSSDRRSLPMVIDADALNALGPDRLDLIPDCAVLTPHPLELSRLLGVPKPAVRTWDRVEITRQAAELTNATVLLKGAFTVVSNGSHTAVLPFAEPLLASAGSGDVLTGAIASLLSLLVPPFEAAVAASYCHALGARLLSQSQYPSHQGALASEIADALTKAVNFLF